MARIIYNRVADNVKTSQLDFGFHDAKGREIGAVARTWTETRTAAPVQNQGGYSCAPEDLGVWFYVNFHKTKNGQTFGASQRDYKFRTIQERDVYMAEQWGKRLKEAKKNDGK